MDFNKLSEEYMEQFLENVTRLLSIPSAYARSDHYPYGEAIDKALKEMLSIGDQDGFKTKNVDGHAGHIEFGEGKELVGILGHLDVVPAGGGWTTPPFEPHVREGKLYARGAQDDKGPVMAAYIAMKLLKDQGFQPKKRVRMILGTDEERDWKGISYYFQHEEMPEVGFTPDATFPVIHAEKGLLDAYITVPLSENSLVKSVTGGEALNMVPAKADVVLKGDREVGKRFEQFIRDSEITGEWREQNGNLTIQLTGKSVHASKPEKGENAIVPMLKFLSQIDDTDHLITIFEAFRDTDGSGLGLRVADDVSGALTISLGTAELVNEKELRLGFNIRYPVSHSFKVVKGALERLEERVHGKLTVHDHIPPLYIEKDDPLIETLLRVYNEATGTEGKALSIGGATYARALSKGVAFGALFENSPDTAHQTDEHIRLDDVKKSIEIYAMAIYELTK